MINVNDVTIEADRVYQEMQYHPASSREEAEYQAATTLVVGEVLRQRALQLGLNVQGVEEPTATDDHIEKLIEHDVTIPEASIAECRQYYQANRERFATSPRVTARHILVAGDPRDEGQRVAAHDIAQRLLDRVRKTPTDFVPLAQAHSECPSSQDGGNLGMLERGQTVPEFEKTVFRASEGLIPTLVETRYGYHVVEVLNHQPGQPLAFEDVQEHIRDYLNTRVRRKAIAQYINALLAEARIEGLELDVQRSPLMQ